ncbi:MAG: hypothetical protein AAFV95_14105 [Bacteroidota bacterium]
MTMRVCHLLLVLFAISVGSQAQDSSSIAPVLLDSLQREPSPSSAYSSIFQSLSSDSIPQITLESDFKNLVKNKYKDDYQMAMIRYQVAGNSQVDIIKIRPRGKSRRKICAFPPLKLKFDKTEMHNRGLHPEYNTLKLVTHCAFSSDNESIVLKEYLIYQLYSMVSEHAFRVQLVKVRYVDTGRKRKTTERFGFLIENNQEMAARINGSIYEKENVGTRGLDRSAFNKLATFQYMIGNSDWQIKHHHNMKLVKPKEGRQFIAVPYDFDYCGLVDAYYAVPNPNFMIKNIKERVFMGICWPMDIHLRTVEDFKAQKEDIYKTINEFELLSRKDRKSMLHYIDGFYEVIENPRLLKSEFNWRCN